MVFARKVKNRVLHESTKIANIVHKHETKQSIVLRKMTVFV